MDLILTLDYELFGNGTGNVFKHMIDPTANLLEICNIFNIKITIFFEVLEYLKIKEEWETGNKMGYDRNPVRAIKNQIKKAQLNGHDIQLHLHPQWLNAEYDNGWIVDNSLFRLPEVTKEKSGYSISELLKLGKSTIENLLKPINSQYSCNILRAGGYNILPSEKVIGAMIDNNFIADSSVYYGGEIQSNLSKYNYQNIPIDIPYWFIKDSDVLKRSKKSTEIMEVPVFALPMRRYKKIDKQRIKVKIQNKEYSKKQMQHKMGSKSLLQKIRYTFEKESVTWDFSLFSFSKMKKYFKEAIKIDNRSQYGFHPFILIGHSKEFHFQKPLMRFFEYIDNKTEINYMNMSNAIEKVKK